MISRASVLAAACALLVLTSGCGSADSRQARAASSEPTGASTETPTETPTATPQPPATAPPGPFTTIPADVRLRHEGNWSAGDPVRTDALPGMCLDPGPDLYPPDTTDRRAVYGETSVGGRGESLGLFSDSRSARRAIEVWRLQTARCGHGLNHVGFPQDWVMRRVEVRDADEAWQSYDIGRPAPGQEDMSPYVPFSTVVRVGNAVYVETARHDGRFDAAAEAALGRAELTSVAAYVPTLAVFGS